MGKVIAGFDPELCQYLDLLGIKRSCFFKRPKGERKYYISIKEDIEKYRIKGSHKYKFPCYDIESRAYDDYVIWDSSGPAYLHVRGFSRSPRVKVEVFLTWESISLSLNDNLNQNTLL